MSTISTWSNCVMAFDCSCMCLPVTGASQENGHDDIGEEGEGHGWQGSLGDGLAGVLQLTCNHITAISTLSPQSHHITTTLHPQSHHITATLHSVPTITSYHRHSAPCPHSHITSPPLCTLSPQSHHITATLHSVPTVTQTSLNPATSVPLYTLSTVTLPSLNSSIQNWLHHWLGICLQQVTWPVQPGSNSVSKVLHHSRVISDGTIISKLQFHKENGPIPMNTCMQGCNRSRNGCARAVCKHHIHWNQWNLCTIPTPEVIIIMHIYHALTNTLSAHMIHINLNMIFCTHVEHSPTKTIYIKYYKKIIFKALQTHIHTHTHTHTHSQMFGVKTKLKQDKPDMLAPLRMPVTLLKRMANTVAKSSSVLDV